MFVEGAKILVKSNGLYLPVEELDAGDTFFDPLVRRYCTITRVMSRRLELTPIKENDTHPLRPILFSAGSLNGTLPKFDVAVSPMQRVMVNWKYSDLGSSREMRLELAKNAALLESEQYLLGNKEANYFAIFTHGSRFMDVAGLLMQTYDAEIYINSALESRFS